MPTNAVTDAIAFYHDLLTPEVAGESWELLERALRDERLVFGERPICTVLRPHFVSRNEARLVDTAASRVLGALRAVFESLPSSQWEPVLGLSPTEAALASIDCGFSPYETIGRLDGFLMRDGRFGFVEYNSESPGGIAFGAALARIFSQLPVMRRFTERYEASTEPVLDHTLDALLASYRQWGGTAPSPRIAIVDWREARTYTEFVICREAFRERGYEAEIVDPRDLELENGRLRSGAFEIDIVYRRVVASEVAARLGLEHPLVRAAADRAACVASGFRALALLSKAVFALASDPRTNAVLTPEQRAAVDAYVPWTRIVRDEATTDWEGNTVSLLEFAAAKRERLVVKPATEYGGSGVVLGWCVEQDAWEAAVRGALDRPSVLQRRIDVPTEPFPRVVDSRVEMAEFHSDVDPYVFHGQTSRGLGTRLSASQLLNVSAGGGSAAPVFVVEPRR